MGPFHKLIQWLLYSLIDLFNKFKINTVNTELLTALPEYRNGGMIIDMEIVELKDKNLLKINHSLNSDIIIEWRCLTIVIIDMLKKKINKKMNKDFHLGQILEGGTWSLGRELSLKRRGLPPLLILSNGTIM